DNSTLTLGEHPGNFIALHPYAYGMTGEAGVKGGGHLMCGVKDPTGDWLNFIRRFDALDVQAPSYCYGYVCPMVIRVYSSAFHNMDFNGYYISNFVGEKVKHQPTYKHSSRNLYIWAVSSSKYLISKFPSRNFEDCPPYLEIEYDQPRDVLFDDMGLKYCFSLHANLRWKSAYDKSMSPLNVEWIEFHPLFSGQEFDLAIIGLDGAIQRQVKSLKVHVFNQLIGLKLFESTGILNFIPSACLNSMGMCYIDQGSGKTIKSCIPSKLSPKTNASVGFGRTSMDLRNLCSEGKSEYIDPPIVLGDTKITMWGEVRQEVLEYEESRSDLKDEDRQIRNLQRNVLECFAMVTLEFANPNRRGVRCYERRKKCLKDFGWCRVGRGDFGFCSEANVLPDKPESRYPLFEVQTFIYPKKQCENGSLLASTTRICTGHITRSATEYIFLVERDLIASRPSLTYGQNSEVVVYEVVEYINGIQRPMVRARDEFGRYRTLKSSLEGVCHGAGGEDDYDNGSPTYFRYPIQETWTGQDQEPGNSYAVLYSLQGMTGRFCNFEEYYDTEVLVAHSEVMGWINEVIGEVEGFRKFYDPAISEINMDLKQLEITTTASTTRLAKTTTDFAKAWGNSEPFVHYKDRLGTDQYLPPDFQPYWPRNQLIQTKPPLIYFENYVLDDWDRNSGHFKSCNIGVYLVAILTMCLFS
ncbi:hypothetical protein TCAL_05764, partial [Tigriopus californicus]